MEFECRSENSTWKGYLKNLTMHSDYFEADVSGRSSGFHIIAGQYEHGGFLCIPAWNIGCEIGDYNDSFWNFERLKGLLGVVDAITVVTGISNISYMMEETQK